MNAAMLELISKILFFIGITGIGIIVLRKVPVLAALPKISESAGGDNLALRLKTGIQNSSFGKYISSEIILHKILSKIRILTLKFENMIEGWLRQLRLRAHERNNQINGNSGNNEKGIDNYWGKLMKSTKKIRKKKESEKIAQ